jgi:hypothetical protein
MKIAAYVDESGRHDRTGKEIGAGQIVVCGWVDWADHWATFCNQWQSILNKYGAETYFHFAELAYASRIIRTKKTPSESFQKNPYREWNLETLDSFLYELAELAGGGQKLFVGGFISTRDFNEAKKHPAFSHFAPAHDPYRACLNQFFESFATEVQQQWPYWNDPVSFIFDRNDDKDWNHAVKDAFWAAKKGDSRIAELTFADKTIPSHLPLQAADMLAYRVRQLVENFTDPEVITNPSKLDDLLIRPSFSRATPSYMDAAFGDYSSRLPLRYGNFPWRKKT